MPRRTISDSEAWKKMVLRSMPAPAWLGPDAPDGDVVISSRVRFARNLEGFPFPQVADGEQLREIQKQVIRAAQPLEFEVLKRFSEAERDYLIGCRLISPEFSSRDPGRAVLVDEQRSVSIMINEEDHIRLQAVTAGWSIASAALIAEHVLDKLEGAKHDKDAFPRATKSSKSLRFARTEKGFATASPINEGEGRRVSALFHLIALAHTKRLPAVLKALAEMNLVARGVFGESTRGVGAFFQVSATSGPMPHFAGACEYLITEERKARWDVPRDQLSENAKAAFEFAAVSKEVTLADALRVLAWARWAASAGLDVASAGYREVDRWVATLDVRGTKNEAAAGRHRADFLRERLGV